MKSHTHHSPDAADRARQSRGSSEPAVYLMIQRALELAQIGGELLVDVGCGSGTLWSYLHPRFSACIGVDVVRYDGFPADAKFVELDLESGILPLADESGDLVVAAETIEHLENPRAFFRELNRLTKPGGWVAVTTPNQLSILSLATLVTKKRFSAFQDTHYPTHLTALLEIDLRRMAYECGLHDIVVAFSLEGRIVLTQWHYPRVLSRLFPRACSDNVLLLARKCATSPCVG